MKQKSIFLLFCMLALANVKAQSIVEKTHSTTLGTTHNKGLCISYLDGVWINDKGEELIFKNGCSNAIRIQKSIQPDKTTHTWYEYQFEVDTATNQIKFGVYFCIKTDKHLGLQVVNPFACKSCPDEKFLKYYSYIIKLTKDELIIDGRQETRHPKDLERITEKIIYKRKK